MRLFLPAEVDLYENGELFVPTPIGTPVDFFNVSGLAFDSDFGADSYGFSSTNIPAAELVQQRTRDVKEKQTPLKKKQEQQDSQITYRFHRTPFKSQPPQGYPLLPDSPCGALPRGFGSGVSYNGLAAGGKERSGVVPHIYGALAAGCDQPHQQTGSQQQPTNS